MRGLDEKGVRNVKFIVVERKHGREEEDSRVWGLGRERERERSFFNEWMTNGHRVTAHRMEWSS